MKYFVMTCGCPALPTEKMKSQLRQSMGPAMPQAPIASGVSEERSARVMFSGPLLKIPSPAVVKATMKSDTEATSMSAPCTTSV